MISLGMKPVFIIFCILFSSIGLACTDDKTWSYTIEKKKGDKIKKKVKKCKFVAKGPKRRCRKVDENGVSAKVGCPKTCGTCTSEPVPTPAPTNVIEPVPTPAPTNIEPAPTPAPTQMITSTPLPTNSDGCPVVSVVEGLNIEEYISKSWFVQKQQVNSYQPKESLFCVVATYENESRTVPFFSGTVVSVYNYGNLNAVNGGNQNDGQVLCAREPDNKKSAALLVAPCFLPNFLAGDYWVVALGDNYEWAIISGGQPTEKFDDGCTTKEDGINGSGFWFFTRERVASEETLAMMDAKARSLGFTTSKLIKVEQEGCNYEGAKLK